MTLQTQSKSSAAHFRVAAQYNGLAADDWVTETLHENGKPVQVTMQNRSIRKTRFHPNNNFGIIQITY